MRRRAQTVAGGLLLGIVAVAATSPVSAGARDVPLAPETRAFAAAQRRASSNLSFVQLFTRGHKGYRLVVTAYKASPRSATVVSMDFSRSLAEATQHQTSSFSWRVGRRALRADGDLKPASLVTGKGMGSNGRIAMKLAGRSQYVRGGAPEGCRGSVSYRVGKFTGRLAVNLRDQYFGKIDLRRATAILYREHDLRCPPQPPPTSCPDDLWLSTGDPEAGVAAGFFKTDEGRVDQRVAVARESGDADAVHRISVTLAVPDAFEASEDLTSANVDAEMAGPWLTGDLSYIAPPPASDELDPDCGPYRTTSGIVTGDFTAHFDAIGAVTLAQTQLPASLRRQAP